MIMMNHHFLLHFQLNLSKAVLITAIMFYYDNVFQFNKHIQKAEGQRTPRVEICISVDGVSVQDPKTKVRGQGYCVAKQHTMKIVKLGSVTFIKLTS